jgi:hypothetical protein
MTATQLQGEKALKSAENELHVWAVSKICFGERHAQSGAGSGVIARIAQTLGLLPVACVQTFLLSCFGVLQVINTVPPPEPESLFHNKVTLP